MRRMTIALAICALLAASATAFGACDIFLKIDGIPGTATAPGHRDFVKAESVILAPNTNGEGGIISITKRFDKASPLLARHAGRKTVTSGEMHITKHGYAKTLYSCSFEELQVTDVQQNDLSEFGRGLLGGEGQELEQVTMRVPKMTWEMPEGGSISNVRNVFADFGNRRIPLAAFGIGTSGGNTRVGIVAEKTPPSGLLSGNRISAVGLVLMGEEGTHHLLSTGRAGVDMSGTINPAQVGILSDNDPLFGVILSPGEVNFGQ